MTIEYHDIVLNEGINYYYNPFGGITDDEVTMVIEPKHSIKEWVELLQNNRPIIIQFVGKKGRGKTTHLKALNEVLVDTQVYFLNSNNRNVKISSKNSLVLIDSIHHIPIIKRLQLWKNSKTSFVITTHWKRNVEFFLCKRKVKTYHFRGVSLGKLENIIKKRVSLSSSLEHDDIKINIELLQKLHIKYGDNVRGILNHLYDNFKINHYGH